MEERALRAWEEELRPYLIANSDVLPQLQLSPRDLDVSAYEPAFDSGAANLLRDRTFQNLLLVRLARTTTALSIATDALTQLDGITDLIEVELR